jgi:hypothetical protein
MKVKVPSKNYGIVELFDTIATEMGFVTVQNLEYDCCKVNIAKNIQDGIYEKYLELGREQKLSESDIRVGVTMLLVCSGPKVDENLADNEVEVFDGFIC